MSRAPRVLVAGAVLGQPMGGVRRHNQELLPRLAARLEAAGGGLAVLEGATGIPFPLPPSVERIPGDVPYQPPLRRAMKERPALRAALAAAAAAGRPFDLVHAAHLPAPALPGVPTTHTIHDLRVVDPHHAGPLRRTLGRRALWRALARARRVGVVSEAVRDALTERWPALEGRFHLIGNGYDHLELAERAPQDPPFALHVGHIEPRKGLDALVRALALPGGPPRVRLAGRPVGDELRRLRALAARLGVADRLEHAEPPDDATLAAHYAAATWAVFPSRLEGFGLGPLEAIRAGCATVVSDIPAHRETCADAAMTFAAGDPHALVEALASASPAPVPEHARTWDDCADAWHDMLTRISGTRFE